MSAFHGLVTVVLGLGMIGVSLIPIPAPTTRVWIINTILAAAGGFVLRVGVDGLMNPEGSE